MVMLSVTPHNLQKLQFRAARGNVLFDDSVYDEFTRLLAPPFHYANQGAEIHCSEENVRVRMADGNVAATVDAVE